MQFTKAAAIDAAARRLLQVLPRYAAAAATTGVALAWLAAVGDREGGAAIFNRYFGNGDPLNKPTVNVPAGRGGFATFEAGLLDALRYMRLDQAAKPWTWAGACYRGEAWNGFGPRAHGRHTGYLWSGTSIYTGGKYVADGKWDPGAIDEQLGIIPVMVTMAKLNPSLDLPGFPPSGSPIAFGAPPISAPSELSRTVTLQIALNTLGAAPPLATDGSYGRQTAMVVRLFQQANDLQPDGIAGPETWACINAKLSAANQVAPSGDSLS